MRVPNIHPDRITPPVQEYEDRRSVNLQEFLEAVYFCNDDVDEWEIKECFYGLQDCEQEEYKDLYTEQKKLKEAYREEASQLRRQVKELEQRLNKERV